MTLIFDVYRGLRSIIMKMVYTHENYFIVSNVKNIIDAQGIKTFVKNEFSQSAVGELSATDSWPEIWVFDDANFDNAVAIIATLQVDSKAVDWTCENCLEKNSSAFELCWSCQHELPE